MKKGEQYVTEDPKEILPNRKDRPRLIWNPVHDTFGVLALINFQILQVVSRHNSFCYRKTAADYEKAF